MIAVYAGEARDVASIMPVMNSAFDPAYGEAWTSSQCLAILSMPGSQLVLASINQAIVGFALTRWVLEEEELLMIGVSADYQGKGTGRALLEYVIKNAQGSERKELFLEVRSCNRATQFYLKNGFEEVGRRKNYYKGKNGCDYDAITMLLDIF
jgi:[ribosomal protein S18]-alanine N-acetyltransferase